MFGKSYSDGVEGEYSALESGRVELLGRHSFLITRSHYIASSTELSYGDVLELGAENEPTHGIFRVVPKEGFIVSATSDSTVARVSRYNTDEIEIKNGWLLRIYNDRGIAALWAICLLYTSPSPRDATLSRMPSSA